MRITRLKAVWIGTAAAVMVMRGVPIVHADEGTNYQTMYEEQKKRNDDLEKRIGALEASTGNVAVANAPAAKVDMPEKTLTFLGQTEISGFVSASYLYDFNNTHGSQNVDGRTFDRYANQFALNKFKLTLEKPITCSPTNWIAGYRTDLIFGEDASVIHSTGPAGSSLNAGNSFNLGNDGDLEQAYVDINIPVGNGLKVIIGKTVTLMGVEVIEEVANPNWSEGNQFLFVENFTMTGVQLAYQWNDKLDTEFVVFNGWDTLPDNNNAVSFMGRVGYAVDSNTTVAVLGYGGPEQTSTTLGGAGSSGNWRDGIELVGTHHWTDKFTSNLQVDYGHEENVPVGAVVVDNPEWFALGGWFIYDFTDKVELVFRHDYLRDREGTRTIGSGLFSIPAGSVVTTPEIHSSTLTLNYKPMENVQIRPEFRWDHADKDMYNGIKDQFTLGMGVAYLY